MGVGGWQPQVISKATSELGQGIDRLGAGVEDLDTSQTQQNNQLQQAQARAAVLSQTTGALAKLPSLTDAGQVSDLRNNIDSTVQQAASTFKDPRQAALFTADITPHIAETYARFDGRAREINNQNSLANYDTTTTSTINNAATIDDDNLSSSALQGVNSHVQALQDGGVITPTEAFQYRQNATKSYVEARYAYLEQWADTHNDVSRLQKFISTQEPQFTPSTGAPANGPVNQNIPPEGRALLATIYGPESGGGYDRRYSPSGGATFSGFADHPRIKETIPAGQPNAGQTSDAAGAPQFLSSTWDMEKAKLGLTDFSPANQDAAAWDLAKTTYTQKTGRDLLSDLQSRNPQTVAGVASALKGQWSSLPGGVQPGTTTDKFTNQFFSNLQTQTNATPAYRGMAAAPSATALPTQIAAAGDSLGVGVASAIGQTDARFAKESLPPIAKSGEDSVQSRLDALAPTDVKGKTFILSSGASNASSLDPATYLPGEIKSLMDKGAAKVVVLGTGIRPDLAPLNAKLQAEAQKAGAAFQPLDAGMLSPDGVHPTTAGYKAIAQQVARLGAPAPSIAPGQVAGPGAPATTPGPSVAPSGLSLPTDPPRSTWPPGAAYLAHSQAGDPIYVGHDGAPLPDQLQPSVESARAASNLSANPVMTPSAAPLAPPESQWPPGTTSVKTNPDGTFSYVAKDGATTPVPGSTATGSPNAWLPQRPTGSILDVLPAQEHAQLLMRAQMALDRISRRNDMASQQASKQAVTELDGIAKAAASGLDVNDNVWSAYRATYAASPDPNVRLAFAETDAIRSNLQSFKGMPPAAIQAKTDSLRADYANSFANDPTGGDTYIKGEVATAAAKYLTQYQSDLTKNPLGRASQDGILPNGVTPLTDVTSIQKRVADAQRVADFYHLDTPQYLMPTERAGLKKVAAAGGQPMIDLASSIVAGGGSAAGAIFKEIGGSAPAFQRIGTLAMDQSGDHSETISDIASYAHALSDPEAKKNLPIFSEGFLRKQKLDDPLGEAYAGFGPDEEGKLRAAANMVLGARASAEGSDPKLDPTGGSLTHQDFYDKAYNDVIGANYDKDQNRYGGVAPIGGHGSWFGWGGAAGKTLAPPNIRADQFDKVVSSITDADLKALPQQPYSGSTPMTMSKLREGQLIAVPDKDGLFRGNYAVRVPDPNGGPPRDILDQTGHRFFLNVNNDKLNANLRSRYPGAFLGKSTQENPPTNAPAVPYRNLPGMLEATASNDAGAPAIP